MDVFARRVAMSDALGNAVKRALKDMLNAITTDLLLLHLVAAGGKFNFRKHLFAALEPLGSKQRSFPVDDTVVNLLWERINQVVLERNPEIADLPPKEIAFKWLDSYVPPPTPPTDAEIDQAWTHEIASSEEAMRQMYEGSARTRKGTLQ